MEPTIKNGSEIFVKIQLSIEPSEIGIFEYNGESLCKRFIKEKSKIILRSDNPSYTDIVLKETDSVRIIGKVL